MTLNSIVLISGEPSGDILGAELISALKRRYPECHFWGLGGPKMQAAGLESKGDWQVLAVRGYWEVISSLPKILGLRSFLLKEILLNPPDLVIGIDAPDFNLALEKKIKKAGIKTIHYVSPSVWAWRLKRIRKIAESVSHLLVLFPFEPAIYKPTKLPVSYVGHPAADRIPVDYDVSQFKQMLGISSQTMVVAMLPGSRVSEVHYHAKLFINTAKRILSQHPNVRFLVPFVTRKTKDMFEGEIFDLNAFDIPFQLMFGHSLEAMMASDGVIVASGTATLEAMLTKKPMVVVYKLSNFSYKRMWKKRLLPYVALPNVLSGKFVVPELLQDDATPENITQAFMNLLNDSYLKIELKKSFDNIHQILKQNNAESSADVIQGILLNDRSSGSR